MDWWRVVRVLMIISAGVLAHIAIIQREKIAIMRRDLKIALKAYNILWKLYQEKIDHVEGKGLVSTSMDKRITIDDVSDAWRTVNSDFKYRDKVIEDGGIRIIFPNGIYYEISTKQVYSSKEVFCLNVDQSLKAINLTVEYLKQEGQNHE